jgi:SAM-dependent methyltransferase
MKYIRNLSISVAVVCVCGLMSDMIASGRRASSRAQTSKKVSASKKVRKAARKQRTILDPIEAQKKMTIWFEGISGFGIPASETEKIRHVGGDATYGEITPKAMDELIAELCPTKKDVFYDLGSGVGDVVAYMYARTPMKKIVGVEFSDTRFKNSERVRARMIESFGDGVSKTLILRHGDIAQEPLKDATIVYLCSTCFPDALMDAVAENVKKLRHNIKVVTLRKFSSKHTHLKETKHLTLPMTWSPNTSVYIYTYTA